MPTQIHIYCFSTSFIQERREEEDPPSGLHVINKDSTHTSSTRTIHKAANKLPSSNYFPPQPRHTECGFASHQATQEDEGESIRGKERFIPQLSLHRRRHHQHDDAKPSALASSVDESKQSHPSVDGVQVSQNLWRNNNLNLAKCRRSSFSCSLVKQLLLKIEPSSSTSASSHLANQPPSRVIIISRALNRRQAALVLYERNSKIFT